MKRSTPGNVPFWYDQRDERTRKAANYILDIVSKVIPFESVVDVGCGVGTWLSVAKERGATHVRGFEGSHLPEKHLKIHRSELTVVELSTPPPVQNRYDLAISLEVAEHIPASSAEDFLRLLVDLSDVVLFSAAIPGQGGNGHVNEQWQGYWITKFAKHGFACFDFLRPLIWDKESIPRWYRQNLFLFSQRADLPTRLDAVGVSCLPSSMHNIVHPKTFDPIVGRLENPGIRRSLRLLGKSVLDRVHK